VWFPLLLISNFVPLLFDKIKEIIYIFCMHSDLLYGLQCDLFGESSMGCWEECVYSTSVGWTSLMMSVKSIWSKTQFNSEVSWLIFFVWLIYYWNLGIEVTHNYCIWTCFFLYVQYVYFRKSGSPTSGAWITGMYHHTWLINWDWEGGSVSLTFCMYPPHLHLHLLSSWNYSHEPSYLDISLYVLDGPFPFSMCVTFFIPSD
jgi:hypothetical protein